MYTAMLLFTIILLQKHHPPLSKHMLVFKCLATPFVFRFSFFLFPSIWISYSAKTLKPSGYILLCNKPPQMYCRKVTSILWCSWVLWVRNSKHSWEGLSWDVFTAAPWNLGLEVMSSGMGWGGVWAVVAGWGGPQMAECWNQQTPMTGTKAGLRWDCWATQDLSRWLGFLQHCNWIPQWASEEQMFKEYLNRGCCFDFSDITSEINMPILLVKAVRVLPWCKGMGHPLCVLLRRKSKNLYSF